VDQKLGKSEKPTIVYF